MDIPRISKISFVFFIKTFFFFFLNNGENEGGGIETLVHVTGGGRLHSCTLVPSSIVTDTHRALQSLHFYLLFEKKRRRRENVPARAS